MADIGRHVIAIGCRLSQETSVHSALHDVAGNKFHDKVRETSRHLATSSTKSSKWGVLIGRAGRLGTKSHYEQSVLSGFMHFVTDPWVRRVDSEILNAVRSQSTGGARAKAGGR
jgi:hypothetical protein